MNFITKQSSVFGCLCWSCTGLSDDDLRETAYEVLLVSVGAAGYVPLYMVSKDLDVDLCKH